MKRNSLKAIGILTVALALSACNRNALYSHYQPIDIDGWQRCDTVCFETAPMAHAGRYIETLGLRINGDFPFTQLTLIVNQQVRPSGLARTDTVEAIITNKEGIILGEGISLYLYNLSLPAMKLLKDDTLSVYVHHDMLRDPLPGITDIGFTLEKEW
jgi:gliding motility-associated lipoprotein GldH